MSDELEQAVAAVPAKLPQIHERAVVPRQQKRDVLWTMITKSLGGREGLAAAAALSANPKCEILLSLLADPVYSRWGIKRLAAKVGLRPSELLDLFRDRKWIETTLAIHEELPEVVRDAVKDARASTIPCSDCQGTGRKKDETPCKMCDNGRVRKPGDNAKLAFIGEAAGITGKKGPMFQFNQQINNPTTPEASFEDLMRRSNPRQVIQSRRVEEDE